VGFCERNGSDEGVEEDGIDAISARFPIDGGDDG
jgi:hypothetical protein